MGGGRSGGGTERVNSEKAREQLAARKQAVKESKLSKMPGVGGALSQFMGEFNLAQQEKGLKEGGYAVAVPGTSFAPQGQAYTEAPGMKSSRELASQRFAVGTTGKDGDAPTPKKGPAGSIGQYSAFKKGSQTGMGYVGDVAGVVKEGEFLGQKTKTFTGKTGYSPSGEKIDKPTGGGAKDTPVVATEPEVTPEVTPEVVPDETVLAGKARRTRYKRSGAGGTILEGFGALYK